MREDHVIRGVAELREAQAVREETAPSEAEEASRRGGRFPRSGRPLQNPGNRHDCMSWEAAMCSAKRPRTRRKIQETAVTA